MENHFDTIIIGGGAAGLYLGAILGMGACVVEGGERVGRKLAATGNGQGNVSNAAMDSGHYYGGGSAELIDSIIREDVLGLFDGIFTTDSRGRIYPAGRQASALTDDLRRKLERSGGVVLTGERVVRLDKGFTATLSSGAKLTAARVVLATGGSAQKQLGSDGSGYALARAFGHTVTPLYPSLVQLKTDTTYTKPLKGLRTDCRVTAKVGERVAASGEGEIIFADYGVTGSAIFGISAAIASLNNVTLEIEFGLGITESALAADISRKKSAGYADEDLLSLTLHKQLSRVIYRAAGSSDPHALAKKAKRFELSVTGTLGFDYAQVTRGGISMKEVTDNLESKLCPNLYFAGEILDVDGDCGGYNLHWAFASAKHIYNVLRTATKAEIVNEKSGDRAAAVIG